MTQDRRPPKRRPPKREPQRPLTLQLWGQGGVLTVLLPEPAERVQPARQGDTYVMPSSPHTGSQSLAEHTQSELQAVNAEGLSKGSPSILGAERDGAARAEIYRNGYDVIIISMSARGEVGVCLPCFVSPVVRQRHPGHLGILAAHGEEEQGEEVANQRGAKGEFGRTHQAQLQLLHAQPPGEHAQRHRRDVDHACR